MCYLERMKNTEKRYNSDCILESILEGLARHRELEKSGMAISSHYIIREHVVEFIIQQVYKFTDEVNTETNIEYILQLMSRLIR